jgi:hypothetical protein
MWRVSSSVEQTNGNLQSSNRAYQRHNKPVPEAGPAPSWAGHQSPGGSVDTQRQPNRGAQAPPLLLSDKVIAHRAEENVQLMVQQPSCIAAHTSQPPLLSPQFAGPCSSAGGPEAAKVAAGLPVARVAAPEACARGAAAARTASETMHGHCGHAAAPGARQQAAGSARQAAPPPATLPARHAPPPPKPPPTAAICSSSGGTTWLASCSTATICRAILASFMEKKETAVPVAPARPVRPILCT